MTVRMNLGAQLNLKSIPEEFRDTFFPATHYLQERKEYYVELDGVDELAINGKPTGSLIPGKSVFRICIEDSLGLCEFQPLAHGHPASDPLWVEVYSGKFPPPDETPAPADNHLSFYQALVSDLFLQAASLPFHFNNTAQRGVTESAVPPTPLFTYYFLKDSVKAFETAIEIVLAEPHRTLCNHPERVMLHEAGDVDADVLIDILQSPETWVEAPEFALSQALQMNGRCYAPERVWQRLPEETFDTPENRFILHFLRQLLCLIEMLPAQCWWKDVKDRPDTQAISSLGSILRLAIANPVFADVGELFHIPFNSQVLLRREGYRDLLVLWQKYHSSWRPLFARWQHAIDVREMYCLYEMWAFFRLINLIAEFNPCKRLEISLSDQKGLGYRSKAIFSGNQELIYNQTFHPRWETHHSYSLVLRPDYVWIIDPARHCQIVLDAKFSMNLNEPDLICEDEIDGETGPVFRRGTPVRENLYKMHTYRDALIGTRAAVILYPGSENLFLSVGGERRKNVLLKEVLSGALNGIGAFRFLPGE